jgi:hypothetical protein
MSISHSNLFVENLKKTELENLSLKTNILAFLERFFRISSALEGYGVLFIGKSVIIESNAKIFSHEL